MILRDLELYIKQVHILRSCRYDDAYLLLYASDKILNIGNIFTLDDLGLSKIGTSPVNGALLHCIGMIPCSTKLELQIVCGT